MSPPGGHYARHSTIVTRVVAVNSASAAIRKPISPLWNKASSDQFCRRRNKEAQLPSLSTTLVAPDPEDAASTTLEPYRLWSFVLKKAHEVWVWIALCRKTRQVVAYALGDRSKQTCRRLWEAIPLAYRQGHCFTDFWAA
jgi:hypothetical protein